jgi:uncharacterized protein (DUF697 family)
LPQGLTTPGRRSVEQPWPHAPGDSKKFGLEWSNALAWRFASILGPGILLSFGGSSILRQFIKLVPVAGTAAAAATSFAVTWAVGEAAMVFFGQLAGGELPNKEKVRDAFRSKFTKAKEWRKKATV